MIYAFNFTCNRDYDLSVLMTSTLQKRYANLYISVTNTDHDPEYKNYGNGAGWPAGMLKVKRMRQLVNSWDPTDKDFLLSVDSDVVFSNPEVFTHINPMYGIIGVKHRPEYKTHFRSWSHMSGALIFIRGDIAKKIVSLQEHEFDMIRQTHFKGFDLTENEDVMLSYFAKYVGSNYLDLGEIPGLASNDFEQDCVLGGMKSFYHLNYCPTRFLGEPVEGKWDIPKVLKKKGIVI
jgi:hypothetical protein